MAFDLTAAVTEARAQGHLLESTTKNLQAWLSEDFLPPWALASLEELFTAQQWNELNDRFFEVIAFGTGGMRNRTIGRHLTAAERGQPSAQETPTHAAVGSAYLNDFNVIRATLGLYRYCARYLEKKHHRPEIPRLVIAHDVRHFSPHFSRLVASTWRRLGGYAMMFDGPRSTPQLSFTVRYTQATCGIVLTASHNPAHDNGYKVYFEDGAQVVFPHAEGIIHEVYRVKMREVVPFLEVDTDGVVTLGASADQAYLTVLQGQVMDEANLREAQPQVVFSAIHGTGGVTVPAVLEACGVKPQLVEAQMRQDPRFPTVKSPNPENAEALSQAIALAEKTGADLVLATDPDADRMGAAVRNREGKMTLLTGNMIGSLLAEFRIRLLKEKGQLPPNGTSRAALIKTFVTTPLQEAIAEKHGLKFINTLTGFKWIGEKLKDYEERLVATLKEKEGLGLDYAHTSPERRRKLLLEHSTWYVFGGEESYGYLASDEVRDKDANAACLMFVEMVGWLRRQNRSVLDFLDELYLRYGYYLEDLINIYYEGAAGALRIRAILDSYRASPPKTLGDYTVEEFLDFGQQDLTDTDGKAIPKQDFFFLRLDNGYRFAVRGSGTEPKLKIYLFAQESVASPADLAAAKERAHRTLKAFRATLEADTHRRAGA